MDPRALVIGPDEFALIEAALERAKQNPVSAEIIAKTALRTDRTNIRLKDRKGPPRPVTPENQSVKIPFGFRANITFESQPAGLCRHLSISVEEVGKLPNPYAVQMIAEAFGITFPPNPDISRMWLEEFEPGHSAVNILVIEPT